MAEQPRSPPRDQPSRSAAETMMRWELLKILTGVRDQRLDPGDVVERIMSAQKSGEPNQLFLNGPMDADKMKNVDKALHALAHEQDNSKGSSPQAEGPSTREREQDSGLKELRLPTQVDIQAQGDVRRQPSVKSTKVRYRSSGDSRPLQQGVASPRAPSTPSPKAQAFGNLSKSPSPSMSGSPGRLHAPADVAAPLKNKTSEGLTVQSGSSIRPPYPLQQPVPRASPSGVLPQATSQEPAREMRPHPRSSPQQVNQTISKDSNPSRTTPERMSGSHGGRNVTSTKPRDPRASAHTTPAQPQPQQQQGGIPGEVPGYRASNASGTVQKSLLSPGNQKSAQVPPRAQQMSPSPTMKSAVRTQNMNNRLPSQSLKPLQGGSMNSLSASNTDMPRQQNIGRASPSHEAIPSPQASNRDPLNPVVPSKSTAPPVTALSGFPGNPATLDKFAESKSVMDFDSSSEDSHAATPASMTTSSPGSQDTLLEEMAAEAQVPDHGIELVEGDFTPEQMFELFMSGKLPKDWSSERNTGSAVKLMSLGALYASQAYLGKGARKLAVEVANSLGVFS